MNYIEEELRRQAAAFAAMLDGGTDREKGAAEGNADSERMQEAEGAKDGALRRSPAAQTLKRDSEGEMTEWNRMLWRRSAQNFRQAANALGLTAEEAETAAAKRVRATETGDRRAGSRMGGSENPGEATRMQAGGGADTARGMKIISGSGETKGAFGGFEKTLSATDGGMSAAELSRTFQRDARRYDGGYPLY